LPLSNNFLNNSQSQIIDYVRGPLRIAEKRIFQSVESGGLGLFPVEGFLQSQRCAWLRRSLNLDEIWKIELYVKSPNNLLLIKSHMFNKDLNPILYTIAESIEKLMVGHTRKNQNYKKAVLFDNAAFTLGLRSRLLLNHRTWGQNDAANTLAQYTINFRDVYEQNGTLKAEFRDRFGIRARSELENNF
jgi:hypothetical protein